MEKLLIICFLFISISCSSAKKEPETKPAENSTPQVAENSTNQTSSASNSKQMSSNNTSVRDYFNVPGPIRFNNQDFLLSWSSNPSPNYFKHEYIPAGTDPEKYNEMIMLELLLGDANMDAMVEGKINELNARKATDPMARYESTTDKKSGEKHFSFLMSAGDGANKVLEWNFYRYLPYVASSGKKGVSLFAYSKRAYGASTESFFEDLNKNRRQYAIDFLNVKFPEIKLN